MRLSTRPFLAAGYSSMLIYTGSFVSLKCAWMFIRIRRYSPLLGFGSWTKVARENEGV
jgi:hypothetical protein